MVTGGDPLNSTFRGRLVKFVRAAAAAWSAPPIPQPDPRAAQAAVESAARQGLGRVMEHMGELRRDQGAQRGLSGGGEGPPVVVGAGWDVRLDWTLQLDQKQQAIWGSEEAKYGRATTTYGITPQAWSESSATNITLDRVAEFHSEADQQGILYRKAEMDFGINRKDGAILTGQRARTAPVYRTRLQFIPADQTPLAYAVCTAVRKIVDRIPGFPTAEDNLLSAAGHGYSGLEPVYCKIPSLSVPISSRRSVTIWDVRGIATLEWVHPRDFRWHPVRRSMCLDSGGQKYVDPFRGPDGRPTNKLIFHSTSGLGDPHQRGYDYAAAPLHLMKFQSVARWSVMLEYFGISTPYMQYEDEGYADDNDISAARLFLGLLGRGKPALLKRKFGEVKITPTPPGVDARGQHAAILGVVNVELLRMIQGQALTSEPGGTGATYSLANVQADSLEAVQLLDACQEADTMTHQLVIYIIRENLEQFARAFKTTPDQIMAVAPRASRVVDRRQDPAARLALCVSAEKEFGIKVDKARVAEELSIPVVQDGPDMDELQVDDQPPAQDDAGVDDAGQA